jgi:hypothetical protein
MRTETKNKKSFMGEARMVTVIPSNRDVVQGTHERDKDFTIAKSGQLQHCRGSRLCATDGARRRSAMSSAQRRMSSIRRASGNTGSTNRKSQARREVADIMQTRQFFKI